MKYLITIASLILFFPNCYSQIKQNDSTTVPSFDRNKIYNLYSLDSFSDTTNYSKYVWNDKRNLGEILNERPGYYLIDFGMESRNLIKYNSFGSKDLGYFKDGIQVNDNYFGDYDIENISVNEIDKIEEVSACLSFLYGLNVTGKSINVISRDLFLPSAFSRLRYSQDRITSLNADMSFTVPFSEKVNLNIGLNKASDDGRYKNSDFDSWRGRIKFNYYPSPKLNMRFNFNYSQIQRGLNGGLINSTIDSLADPILAKVVNSDSYEKITNFLADLSLNSKLFKNNNSLTKIRFYVLNSSRQYRDEENRQNPNGIYKAEDFRSIQYGLDFKQNIYLEINKKISTNILSGYNGYFNIYQNSGNSGSEASNYYSSSALNYHSLLAKIDIFSDRFLVTSAVRYNKIDNYYFNYGGEVKYVIIKKENVNAGIKAGLSSTSKGYLPFYNSMKYDNKYFNLGVFLNSNELIINLLYFNNNQKSDQEHSSQGINLYADYNGKYFTGYFSIDKFNELFFPDYNLKADISYHNFFFKNKLNLRLGFNVKYSSNFAPITYDQIYYTESEINPEFTKNFFNVDFYIGAKIGSANINFTLANLFNSFNYNVYLYPTIDRGGVLQCISRFTIVWDFLN